MKKAADSTKRVRRTTRRDDEATHCTHDSFNDGDLARVHAACCRAAEIAQGATRRNLDVRLIQRQAAGWKSLVGEQSKSLLIFTDNGYYTWHVFRSDRPKFASNNRMQGTPDENKATMQGSLAYFGTYSVNEGDKTVMFRVEGSTYPNSEGEELKRIITSLTTDELKYVNPSTTLGARVEAVFRRAN